MIRRFCSTTVQGTLLRTYGKETFLCLGCNGTHNIRYIKSAQHQYDGLLRSERIRLTIANTRSSGNAWFDDQTVDIGKDDPYFHNDVI